LIEIRWHGRGGQGAVTAAELLAHASINQGKYAQAAPSFGPERRGAPVQAFNRIDDKPIQIRSEIYNPDIVIVIDPGLPRVVDVSSGLKNKGWIIINTKKTYQEIKDEFGFDNAKLAVIDAKKIALELIGLPIVNTTMLGSAIKVIGGVEFEYLEEAIYNRFGNKAGAANLKALRKAFEDIIIRE